MNSKSEGVFDSMESHSTDNKELLLVEHKIKVARGEIKVLEKQIPKNRDVIDVKETEMTGLILKYEELAGQPYVHSLADMAMEFCEDYYFDLDNDNDDRVRFLERYYHEKCTSLIIGWGRINGRDKIIDNMLTKFKGVRIKHSNLRVVLDRVPPAGRLMVINCTSSLQLDNDAPRRIKTVFEIEKCTADDSNPLVIVSELFQVLDSRPLYHLPEIDKIPKGTNDNWEPQFKPAFIEPEVVVPVVVETPAAEAKKAEGDEEESLQEGESYEDDEESVQASIVSGVSGTKSPKGKASAGAAGGGNSVVGVEAEVLKEQLNEEDEEEDGSAAAAAPSAGVGIEQPPESETVDRNEEHSQEHAEDVAVE